MRDTCGPVILVDGANVDDLDLTPEQRLSLKSILGSKLVEADKAKRREGLSYQATLAEALTFSVSPYSELDCDGGSVDDAVFDVVRELESGSKPHTVHRFYRSLYGIEPNPAADSNVEYAFMQPRGDGDYDVHCFSDLPIGKSILVNHRDRDWPFVRYRNYGEFLKAIGSGESSFIYTGCFWAPSRNGEEFLTARRNAMISIGAFVVDLDRCEDENGEHFDGGWVMRTLLEHIEEFPQVEPNYISLTGTGIQLWYVFGRQIPLLSKKSPRRDKYGKVVKLLYRHFSEHLPSNRFVVDEPCATICHAFRAPGSDAKLHYPTRMFVNERHETSDPLELSRFLGGPLMPYDCEDWNEEAYRRMREERVDRRELPATEKQLSYLGKLEKMGCVEPIDDELTIGEADELIKRGEIVYTRHSQALDVSRIETDTGHSIARRPRNAKLYEYTLDRLRRETTPGHRYNALFGLAGLGWNCCIPKNRVRRDMESLLDTEWGRKLGRDGKPLQQSDLKAALTGYNALGALRPKAALESRLDWGYAPPQKRNGRTSKEHLWGDWLDENDEPTWNKAKVGREAALSVRSKKLSNEKTAALAEFLRKNPSASKRMAAAELHMSPPTVQKYWQAACARAGVADGRTGNHSPR